MADLEKEIQAIKTRNTRVELDKAWETSKTRLFAIMILTYLLMALLFYLLGVDKFYLNAVIPTIGFVLSTLSLGWLKNIWINQKRNNK